MESKTESTPTNSVDETQSISPTPSPNSDSPPFADPATPPFQKSSPEKKTSPFGRKSDFSVNTINPNEEESKSKDEESVNDDDFDYIINVNKAVSNFFEEMTHEIIDQYNQSNQKSFQFSQSRGFFSLDSKGIMVIKVKASYLEERAAIQIIDN